MPKRGRSSSSTSSITTDALFTRSVGVAEVVVPPRSALIGETVFPGMVTDSGDLVVLAVQRKGEDQARRDRARAGDTLLVQGPWDALEYHLDDPEVLSVDDPAPSAARRCRSGRRKAGLGVLAAMVVLLATGAVPPAVAGLLAAGAMVLCGSSRWSRRTEASRGRRSCSSAA